MTSRPTDRYVHPLVKRLNEHGCPARLESDDRGRYVLRVASRWVSNHATRWEIETLECTLEAVNLWLGYGPTRATAELEFAGYPGACLTAELG